MITGKVKWFNKTKGYGFVQPSDKSKDAFIHISALKEIGLDDILEGQKIEYELENKRGKESIVNLKLL